MTIPYYIYPFLSYTTIDQIIQSCCEFLEVDIKKLKSETRKRETLFKRYMIVSFIRDHFTYRKTVWDLKHNAYQEKKYSRYSYPLLGKVLNRHHSSVIHEYSTHGNLINDPQFKEYRTLYDEFYIFMANKYPQNESAINILRDKKREVPAVPQG